MRKEVTTAAILWLAMLSIIPIAAGADRPAKPPTATKPSPASPCDKLDRAVDPTAGATARLEACLAAARCALVVECARPLSLNLMGLERSDKRILATVDRGFHHLDCAASALQDLPKVFDDEVVLAAEDRIEMLRAFAKMFRALAGEGSSKEDKALLTDACIGLALYVDDPVVGIAGAAKFWQGAAYRRAGRPERTLQLLRPAIGTGASGRVDFLMSVERCRALADLDRFPAALSLSLRVDAFVGQWFKDESEAIRSRAKQTLGWIRAKIYRRWAEVLRKQGKPDRARAAEVEARKALGDITSPLSPGRLLLLDETIVVLSEWRSDGGVETSKSRNIEKSK